MRSFKPAHHLRSPRAAVARTVWPLVFALPVVLGGCASIVIHDRPVFDSTSLEVPTATTPAPAEPLALVQAGVALDKKHPEWAVTYYRDAALKALPYLRSDELSPQLDIDTATGRREFTGGPSSTCWRRLIARRWSRGFPGPSSWRGRELACRVEWVCMKQRDGKRPCQLAGSKSRASAIRRAGEAWAAPVVVFLTRSGKWGEPGTETTGALTAPCESHFPKTLYRAASATLRPGSGTGEPLAVLELHDPVLHPAMNWQATSNGAALPLAYDMTVPLARQFHVANLNLLGAIGVLFPSEYNGRTGIFLLDPYEPGKIPVVFVHGLMSSPEAWDNAMNDLRGDPELRKRYQFWMFFYSTGNPILASGARFRKSLNDLRAELDPERKDPAFDRMVLIGHSMGGLLSRLAIASSGQTLWNTASRVPPEQIEMDPQLKDLMVQALIFEPVPMVSRVVFVATPHRGSPLGDELVGRLASKMIRVPSDILQIRKTLAQYNGQMNVSEAFRGSRYATSVAQLGIGNPILQSINKLPMSEAVPFHSIIGYNGKEPLPAGGDGVVPYTSAHVDGALSELIVSSDHSSEENDTAIQEMRRILTVHYNEYALQRQARTRGEKPPARITRPPGQTPVRYALTPPAEPPGHGRVVAKTAPPDLRIIR